MNVIYHPRIKADLRSALAYYEGEGGRKLGDRFFHEGEAAITKVTRNPQGCHFVAEGLRRVGLESFPYHFLYEETARGVHFLVLRHDRRHPGFGLRRRRLG